VSLVRLGARSSAAPDASALLLECHSRIRAFASLAVRLATVEAPEAEIADAAERVRRYFAEALPLHVRDEERSVARRLRRFAVDTAAALDDMEREHRGHAELLAILTPAWASVRAGTGARERTLSDATLLKELLEAHLAAEERLVLPALARLPAEQIRAIVEEMRARRAR
jgi:iron-sulfur cluster repair protein YtfE (RIC family)